MSTCRDWWTSQSQDPATSFNSSDFAMYNTFGDCGGPWQVWWRQNFPGRGNAKVTPTNQPVLNWWPYMYC